VQLFVTGSCRDQTASDAALDVAELRRYGGVNRRLRSVAMHTAIWLSALVLLLPIIPAAIIGIVNPPTTSLMMIRAREGVLVQWRWRSLSTMPASLPRAAIAGEDLDFCQDRFGFDPIAIRTQLGVWWSGGRPTGASTIPMQTARTLFLWPDRNLGRKMLEAWLTWPIALLWTRHRQLEVYLNVAEFGPGLFGVDAASRHYFGMPASSISDAQAAELIAVLPAPLRRAPLQLHGAGAWHASVILKLLRNADPRLDCAG
jgi:monofunctional biosynthetic peptidoglycan transglycosylase